jgi:phage repressor protein C with HTH and peptisase S24 domain
VENGDEPIIGHMQFPETFVRSWGRSPTRVEAIQARGDSMYPTIHDGQWVLIDRADRELADGLVYGFRTPDGLRLKRFQKAIDGTPMLVSDNRDLYAPERLSSCDLAQLKVAGRVFLTPRMI